MISVWCKENFLVQNVSKTKELCIDFRTSGQFDGPLSIGGEAVEVMDTFKYVGITLDSKLTFGVYKKCQQRLYLLRKLRSFHVDPKLLLLLYMNIIESVLTNCSICSFPAMSVSNKNMLLRICKTTSKILGLTTQPVSQLTECAMVRKAHAVANDPAHPPNHPPTHPPTDLLPSQRWWWCTRCRKNRFKNSFVPQAINYVNKLWFKCSSRASQPLNSVYMCVCLVEYLKNWFLLPKLQQFNNNVCDRMS